MVLGMGFDHKRMEGLDRTRNLATDAVAILFTKGYNQEVRDGESLNIFGHGTAMQLEGPRSVTPLAAKCGGRNKFCLSVGASIVDSSRPAYLAKATAGEMIFSDSVDMSEAVKREEVKALGRLPSETRRAAGTPGRPCHQAAASRTAESEPFNQCRSAPTRSGGRSGGGPLRLPRVG